MGRHGRRHSCSYPTQPAGRGSARESDGRAILRCFLDPVNGDEFDVSDSHPLGLQQEVAEILVAAPAVDQHTNVSIDGFHHPEAHLGPAVVQDVCLPQIPSAGGGGRHITRANQIVPTVNPNCGRMRRRPTPASWMLAPRCVGSAERGSQRVRRSAEWRDFSLMTEIYGRMSAAPCSARLSCRIPSPDDFRDQAPTLFASPSSRICCH